MTQPKRRMWTTTEILILRSRYPSGGINAVQELLPDRTRFSIYQRAQMLGLRSDKQPHVRQSWSGSPEIDEAIRVAHQRPMKRGDVVKLAKRLGRPVWWVSRRARDLGLTTPRFKEERWSQEEIDILRSTAADGLGIRGVQSALKRAGYHRTENAIAVQRKRQGVRQESIDDVMSGARVAEMLGMDRGTLLRAIKRGDLKAKPHPDYKTRADGSASQYVVTMSALRRFIVNHPLRIDLRKLPAGHVPWFIDLVAGTGPRTEA